MNILVINSGSSSIKFSIFAAESQQQDPRPLLDGELSGIGTPDAALELSKRSSSAEANDSVKASDSAEAIHAVFDALAKPDTPTFQAIGYRVVHPGPEIDRHIRIDDEVLMQLEAAVAFAPLHDPDAIKLIREAMQRFPALPHFACFDTIFHQTMPLEATLYPIPAAFHEQGVRRYGFHGLSCESVVHQLNAAGIRPESMIIAHLGSGCSVTALHDGKSIDTSMGLTPTGGVVMGTRPGDLDPGLIFYLLRQPGATVDSVEQMLNHDAGLKALFGVNDMRKLREASATDEKAKLALRIFTNSVRRAIGGMLALHGADALIFTGGIGEHDAETRAAVCGEYSAAIPVHVIPAEEDLMIARHVAHMYASNSQ